MATVKELLQELEQEAPATRRILTSLANSSRGPPTANATPEPAATRARWDARVPLDRYIR